MVRNREIKPICFYHGERLAIAVCTNCGAFLCPDCVSKAGSADGNIICTSCRAEIPTTRFLSPVWEDRRGAGAVRAFFATWRAVVFNSRAFFTALPPEGPVFKPLVYAIICLAVGLIGALPALFQSLGAVGTVTVLSPGLLAAAAAFALVILPPFYITAFSLTVVFLHVLARGFGGNGNLVATFRAVSYAQSASVVEIIPVIGGLLAFLLRLFFYGRAVPAVHGLTPVRSFLFYLTLSFTALGFVYLFFRLATGLLRLPISP